MEMHFIYALVDSRWPVISRCYLGRSINPEKRFRNHLSEGRRWRPGQWIACSEPLVHDAFAAGYEPWLVLLEHVEGSWTNASCTENLWMLVAWRDGFEVVNPAANPARLNQVKQGDYEWEFIKQRSLIFALKAVFHEEKWPKNRPFYQPSDTSSDLTVFGI